MDIYDDHIENLISNYAFSELAEKDKSHVVKQMTEIEYDNYHRIATSSQSLSYSNVDVPPEIKQSVDQILATQWQPTHHKYRHIVRSLLWMMVGGTFTFLYINMFSFRPHSHAEPPMITQPSDTVFVTITDTLREIVQTPPEVITKEVIRYIEKQPQSINQQELVTLDNVSILSNVGGRLPTPLFSEIKIDYQSSKKGKPIGEEEELMEFLRPTISDGLE